MKKILFALLAFLMVATVTIQAQCYRTTEEIILNHGNNYSTGITEDGFKYMYYDKTYYTAASSYYMYREIYYLVTLDDGTEACWMYELLEPVSENNNNVKFYNASYVKIGEMKWYDYTQGVYVYLIRKHGILVTRYVIDLDQQRGTE